MRSISRPWRRVARAPQYRSVAVATVAAVLMGAAAPGVGRSVPGSERAPGALRPSVHAVTLITGDRVTVTRYADGRQVATVQPATEGDSGGFSTREVDGRVYVTPHSAIPYLSSGRLDPALFNVTDLIAQGYDDSHAKKLPLLLRYGSATRLSAQKAPAGAERRRVLDSIDGVAVTAAKGDLNTFWDTVTGTADKTSRGQATRDRRETQKSPSASRLAGGLEKIWLDRKVRVSLDHSVPQIGAPEVWKTGVTGKGVKVAVLDTGVDATHPDLAGRVGETHNFSTSDSTRDAVGHGTHVAATIAGSGAGANGTRKGVAPDAELLIGKVLDDSGSGAYSNVLAGMEWAAHSGARVVNMSLGGPAAEGDDPLVTAVDHLTDETGTLFVVAAGNEGPGLGTVGSPGVAPSALTVGAVDRNDDLAGFSSRGPVGEADSVKPELTAPGVDIVAARAAGTRMGTPENDLYTSASGTSMATPHVAGAAALLAQSHPKWKPQDIKNALVGSSKVIAGQSVDEQGGGRVDVAGAFARTVVATGALDLGVLGPDSGTTTRTAAYTNVSAKPVRLTLSLRMTQADGSPAPADAITTGAPTVTVEPGETAQVPIEAHAADLERGRWSGYVTATPDDGTPAVHTALAVTVRGAMRTLTMHFVDRDGNPAVVPSLELYGSDYRFDTLGYAVPGPDGTVARVTLPEDTYFFKALVSRTEVKGYQYTEVLRPELKLDSDKEITLDARTASPIQVRTPKASEQQGMIHFGSYRAVGTRKISTTTIDFDSVRTVSATPTTPVKKGTFEFYSRWRMVAPRLQVHVPGKHTPELTPVLFHHSPAVDGTRRLPLVYVEPDSLAGRDLRGKAVLMHTSGGFPDQMAAVAKTGAAALVIINEFPIPVWSRWDPTGERDPMTTMHLPQQQGEDLLAWLKRQKHQSATLDLSGTSASPYLYDLTLTEKGAVPDRLTYTVNASDTATVESRYHRPGTEAWTIEQRFAWRPWQDTSFALDNRSLVKLPLTRVETISAGDTVWLERMAHKLPWDTEGSVSGGMTGGLHRYSAGQHLRENWYGSVVRPTAPAGNPGFRSVRQGDTIALRLAEMSDGESHHYGFAGDDETDQVRTRLYRDGTQVADQARPWGDFPAGKGEADYRLQLETFRDSPAWTFSTRTDTSWSFRSAPPASGQEQLLPLLLLDYDAPVDTRNQVKRSSSTTLRVTARHQDGWTGEQVKGMRVWASTDDGRHWTSVPASLHRDGTYEVRLGRGLTSRSGFVSLRAEAWDGAGNKVEQTVLRAFGVR
ncbi:S8 family serine peptidase [Streptomyces krungchingensis]|uniref:S8 family serine peptidase n=1 Tax=Streptomyces krungchingensis TaxID=1565034 RepID=UPI003CF9E392